MSLTPVQQTDKDDELNKNTNAAYALLDLGKDLPHTADKGTNTQSVVDESAANYRNLLSKYQTLLKENRSLKRQIEIDSFNYVNLTNSQIKTFTGLLSIAVFQWVLNLVSPYFKKFGKLSLGNQLLLLLMKLRLNLINKDLAVRFGMSCTQVSRVLNKCLPVLASRLSFLIQWPTKSTIIKNMPKAFKKHYKKCRVIIDCSEIFMQRPTNLDARAKTFSNYKHHNTMKFLIGITPYGAVSFLSKCWGGRTSDNEIRQRSGFLDKLEHGDLILADRGFLIEEDLATHGATLAIPPFERGKIQLSQLSVLAYMLNVQLRE